MIGRELLTSEIPSKAKIQRFAKIFHSENNPLYGTNFEYLANKLRI